MRYSLFSISLLIILFNFNCKESEHIKIPYEKLDWLNKTETTISVTNSSSQISDVKFSYFNKSTREELDANFTLNSNQTESITLEIFRPEIIKISYDDKSLSIFVIPGKTLEFNLNDSIALTGTNTDLYSILMKVQDHQIKENDFNALMSKSNSPQWLRAYLRTSRKLKESYKIYQQAGYNQFVGVPHVTISKKDSLQSEVLLSKEEAGLYHNYYSLLKTFKNNFEFMNKNKSLPVNLENYAKRKNLFDNLAMIKNSSIRNNMIALHIEGNLLRKRKSFKDKEKIINYAISLLPEEYVLKLNEIEKEYTNQNYNTDNIKELLEKELRSKNKIVKPIEQSKTKFTLLKFWFAGCAPCKKQIPYEKKLLDKFNTITLSNFCYATDIKTWEKYIDKNKPAGHHYFLNEENYTKYKEVFSLGYAPRYVLLNENQDVVCWECANPSNIDDKIFQ